MTTYPTTPTTLTLASAMATGILRDYRESGFVVGTAIVRSPDRPRRDWTGRKIVRKFDFATAKPLTVAGAAATVVSGDIVQHIPIDINEVITGGSVRIIRANTAAASTATVTVNYGNTAISGAVDLKGAAGAMTVVDTATPIVVAATDTVDLLFQGYTATFDGAIEVAIYIQPNHA